MSSKTNRQIVVAARPNGNATLNDFGFVEQPVPVPGEGEVLSRNVLISIDPYQRNLMGNASSESPPVDLGQPMPGPTVAIVEQSRNPDFSIGDYVVAWSGWQQYGLSDGADLRKIDAGIAPLSTALGVLGHTGLTAWLGITKFMDPKPGGTLVVTAAAGSVGSVAGQLAKLRGHRVLGIAGGAEKVRYLTEELNLDGAVDYKRQDFNERLAAALPDGLDALLDNVGGTLFEALMPHFNHQAHIAIAGLISQYAHPGAAPGPNRLPDLLTSFLYRFIQVRGFAMPDHVDRYPEFLAEVTPLVRQGKIKYSEEFVDGFDNIPTAFLRLYDRSNPNRGKLIARVG
ncbi:MAG TPA: NADP-dependent oxidoreductase [Castellaniella sp.]|jgi:NADPH-dependent curcumin reductase CurA|nr:NADP-dependent oxidoreductase [Castellaniella sp.]